MKKSLIALAAIAACGAAFAQSSVTITGQITGAYERTGQAGAKGSLSSVNNDATYIQLNGVEDLGGGLKAGFSFEMRTELMTGKNSNASAGHFDGSFLYLTSDKFGAVQIGRFAQSSMSGYDAFRGYGYRARNDYAYASEISNRTDATFRYVSPTFSGFNFHYARTVNDPVVTANPITQNTGSEGQYFRLNYANGPLSLAAGWERDRTTSVADLLAGKDYEDYSVAGSYDFGVAKLMATYTKRELDKGFVNVGVQVPMGATLLKASYRSKTSASARGEALRYSGGGQAVALGVDYNLSKRTFLFADLGHVSSGAQTAYRIGMVHKF